MIQKKKEVEKKQTLILWQQKKKVETLIRAFDEWSRLKAPLDPGLITIFAQEKETLIWVSEEKGD